MQEILNAVLEFFLQIITSVYFLVFLLVSLLAAAIRIGYVALKISALSHLEYSRHFSTDGVFEGGELELIEEVHNDSSFPLFLVRLNFYVPEGLVIDGLVCKGYMKLTSIFSVLPHTTVRKVHKVKAVKRDHYRLETAAVKYHKNQFDYSVPADLYVYPSCFDAWADMEPDLLRAGESISSRRFVEDPFFISGVRDYRFGDPMRSIDFKATAKAAAGGTLKLVSNSFDSSRDYGSMIFLDLTPYPEVCLTPGDSENLVEEGLRAACFIFGETVTNGGKVGFAANAAAGGQKFICRAPGLGSQQIKQILESFAEITAFKRRDYSFSAMLLNHIPLIERNIDIYIVTPYASEQLCRTVAELGRGLSISFVKFNAGGARQ